MGFLEAFYIPVAVAACFLIGYIVKTYIVWIDNKWIPLIVMFSGAVLGCVIQESITLEHIVYGAVSGFASTGIHQACIQCHKENK